MSTPRYGIYGNPEKINVAPVLDQLLDLLSPAGCKIFSSLFELTSKGEHTSSAASAMEIAEASDIIFSLGGDGTMLSAARAIMRSNADAQLLGINLGRLGFISEHATELLPQLIEGIHNNTLLQENRLLIEAVGQSETNLQTGVLIRRDNLSPERENERGDSARLLALNEIVIDNFGSTRMLTFDIQVQGSLLGTLRADGLLVSTPTGSTGYSASAGGSLIEPTSPVMIVAPIAPHSLSVRPVVVPEWYEVDVRVWNDAGTPVLLVADGQEEVVIETPAVIRISGYQNRLKLLRHPSQSYFDLLRTKLLWSADTRSSGR